MGQKDHFEKGSTVVFHKGYPSALFGQGLAGNGTAVFYHFISTPTGQ
jgi:hypothetical protein